MNGPVQITFHGMQHSDAIEAAVQEKAMKLREFYNNIISCRVVIEHAHHNHHKGNLFHVRVLLKVPSHELVISRSPNQNHEHEDVYLTIRDAFDAAKRQLLDFARKQRDEVKRHEELEVAEKI